MTYRAPTRREATYESRSSGEIATRRLEMRTMGIGSVLNVRSETPSNRAAWASERRGRDTTAWETGFTRRFLGATGRPGARQGESSVVRLSD